MTYEQEFLKTLEARVVTQVKVTKRPWPLARKYLSEPVGSIIEAAHENEPRPPA